MGKIADGFADVSPDSVKHQVSEFIATRLSVLRHVRDAMADSQDIRSNKLMLKAEAVLIFRGND